MKFSLSLLAVMAMTMVSTVRGAHLAAQIEGVTLDGPICTPEQEYELYLECVVDMFESMGGELDRRLELRDGGRKLPTCFQCTDQMIGARGHWCFVYCGGRRGYRNRKLTVADDEAHTERFLVTEGQLHQAANECLDDQISKGYDCLGKPEDLTIKIFLSE
jgi:hypothetical protein